MSLLPPTREQLFRLQSEAQTLAEIRADAARRGYSVSFPSPATPGTGPVALPARPDPPARGWLLSAPVCHHPLYYENRNAERYGWSAGCRQPAISTGWFYFNVLTLPYHLVCQPPWSVECNTGLPLPGDPVPFVLPAR